MKPAMGACTESAMPASRGHAAEALRPRIVHPEAALEVDLAGRVTALEQELDGLLRALAGRHARGAESQLSHAREPSAVASARPGGLLYAAFMAKRPSKIELLELDIDLRLADLWREAGDVDEWTLEVVAAFLRAAYGKGYCDALTEDSPGSLCEEHGYQIPDRRPVQAREL